MLKIKLMLLSILCVFILEGCDKCLNTEYKEVEVLIIDEYHSHMWIQPIKVGKTTSYIIHHANWDITVQYNEKEYTIDNEDIYNQFKDKLGQKAIGVLEIKTYDDGSLRKNIIAIK